MSHDTITPVLTEAGRTAPPAAPKPAGRRRPWGVYGVRVALVIAWLGSWEIAARTVIDPFYYSMPSKIWERLVDCRSGRRGDGVGVLGLKRHGRLLWLG